MENRSPKLATPQTSGGYSFSSPRPNFFGLPAKTSPRAPLKYWAEKTIPPCPPLTLPLPPMIVNLVVDGIDDAVRSIEAHPDEEQHICELETGEERTNRREEMAQDWRIAECLEREQW